MRVVSVMNQKGGAGKTTTAMNVAAAAAESSDVLLVDVDPQGSAAWWAGRAGDDLPFDFAPESNIANLAKLRELPYDLIIVDTPGSLEKTGVLKEVVKQSDFVILPSEPEALSFQPLLQTVETVIRPSGVDFRVLLNKLDPRVPGDEIDAQKLIDGLGLPRFRTGIHSYKVHTTAPLSGTVVTQYRPTRASFKAINDYRKVTVELFAIWANSPRKVGV